MIIPPNECTYTVLAATYCSCSRPTSRQLEMHLQRLPSRGQAEQGRTANGRR